MCWVDKDGILHQPARKWYTKRETEEIYAKGGYVVLAVKELTLRQKSLAVRDEREKS